MKLPDNDPADWKSYFQWLQKESPIMIKMQQDPVQNAITKWIVEAEIVSAERLTPRTGRLVIKFPVYHEYLNPRGTLQGGMQAAIYDVFTSWIFVWAPGWKTSVSTSINTSYFKPAVEGDILLLECEVVQAGRQIGMARGVIKRASDGAIISTCEHHVFNITPASPKANI